jgi:hypothetical protein
MDATIGEANVALLVVSFAADFGCSSILLEGNSQLIILAINKDHLFLDWLCAPVIGDIQLHLLRFDSWTALKVSRCANSRAHSVAKWAASNNMFGSIPAFSPFLCSLSFKNGRDPHL